MSPTIRIDDDVFTALQAKAAPFVDTPNDVLRRVLGLGEANSGSDETGSLNGGGGTLNAKESVSQARRSRRKAKRKATGRPRRQPRAPAGVLLPEKSYERPLLEALDSLGGSAPASQAIDVVGQKLDGKLTDWDRTEMGSGSVRWRNRVQFVRLRLVHEGFLSADSGRGVWKLTEKGRSRLRARSSEQAS